jgi:tetratricopeptide (TPR) repeat protein
MSNRTNFITAAALTVASAFVTPLIAAPSGGGAISEPQPRQKVNPEQSYKDGIEALQSGEYKLAEKKFGEVLSVAGDHPEANYYMGLVKVAREKEKSAVRYFKKAIKERDNFVEAREQLAIVYTGLEKPEDAEEQLAALREIKEACTEDTCDKEFVERTERAIANVEAALSGASEVSGLQPIAPVYAQLNYGESASADVRYGEAIRLINQSRYDEAITALNVAQGMVGPNPDILNYLGYSHRKLGLFDKAQAYYSTALKIDPDHLGANEYLGELYLEVGELDKAREQLATLDRICEFGCAEREDLARLIEIKDSTRTAAVD